MLIGSDRGSRSSVMYAHVSVFLFFLFAPFSLFPSLPYSHPPPSPQIVLTDVLIVVQEYRELRIEYQELKVRQRVLYVRVQTLKERNQPAHEMLKYVLHPPFLLYSFHFCSVPFDISFSLHPFFVPMLHMLTSFIDKSKRRSGRKKESGIG
jgi:hypothetical protein